MAKLTFTTNNVTPNVGKPWQSCMYLYFASK